MTAKSSKHGTAAKRPWRVPVGAILLGGLLSAYLGCNSLLDPEDFQFQLEVSADPHGPVDSVSTPSLDVAGTTITMSGIYGGWAQGTRVPPRGELFRLPGRVLEVHVKRGEPVGSISLGQPRYWAYTIQLKRVPPGTYLLVLVHRDDTVFSPSRTHVALSQQVTVATPP